MRRRVPLIIRLGLLVAALALTGLAVAQRLAAPKLEPAAHAFQQRWGISVLTSNLDQEIAPLIARPSRPVHLADLSPKQITPALALVADALALYPPYFVRSLLSRVVLADNVTVWGKEAGGLFAAHTIVLNTEGLETPSGRSFIAGTVHHEMSSLVRQSITFNVSQWEAANPPGFTYAENHTAPEALDINTPVEGDDVLHQMGFVNAYGQTDLDNDWNTYAESIFGDGAAFAVLLARFPAMRPKARILIEIYLGLAPELINYFDRFDLRHAAN